MPARLALCDLGAPGWGELWFPHSAVLLYSHLGMAMSVLAVTPVRSIHRMMCLHLWLYAA